MIDPNLLKILAVSFASNLVAYWIGYAFGAKSGGVK